LPEDYKVESQPVRAYEFLGASGREQWRLTMKNQPANRLYSLCQLPPRLHLCCFRRPLFTGEFFRMPRSASLPGAKSAQLDPAPSNPQTAQVLLQIFRVMFPHDFLDDSYYERVAQKVVSIALVDRPFADLIQNGIGRLKSEYSWKEISESDRLQALKEIESSPFFQSLRIEFILHFYGDPRVWSFLGYEGPSNDLGGYVNRGFDEIDWLKTD
jgi:hypothetical protein